MRYEERKKIMAKFNLGQTVMTSGVAHKVANDVEFSKFVLKSMGRHVNGDWGCLSKEDKQLNDSALKNGNERIFSAYEESPLPKLWIITERDRSVTTALFPSEY